MGIKQLDLMGKSTGLEHITILPTSVIDVDAQYSDLRETGGHYLRSSRSEFSPFPKEIAQLCFELYLKNCEKIIDPFAGWGERYYFAKKYGKEYTGYDISEMVVKYAKEHYDSNVILADARLVESVPEFDGLITSPPYFDLEKYSGKDGDLSNCRTLWQFEQGLIQIFKKFYDASGIGTPFCVVIGDFRRNGVYFNLSMLVQNIFLNELRAELVDKVIISRKNVSKIKTMVPQAIKEGYTVKVHEYLYVFRS